MINVQDIWCTDSEIWIRTVDGREAGERFADTNLCAMPRLQSGEILPARPLGSIGRIWMKTCCLKASSRTKNINKYNQLYFFN